jgi:uncharacterized hydrophobic protein (TIGR00271 family)
MNYLPWNFIKDLINLKTDFDEEGASEYIKGNISFKGINFWTLVFAIIVASVGLNVNSTAVIIGAMLISPLMGPIVGAGFAIGTNDFGFLKRSVKNLLIAVGASILTATLYFIVSPLDIAQSELLARTQPTTYDVLIAFVGGAAGIVAATRKDRFSNVIPGVAIATALMPPLCTVGYGLANGEPRYFLGAFFLFLINSVYISIATFLVVKFLGFKKHHELDEKTEKRMHFYVYGIATLVFVPSLILGWIMIHETITKTKVNQLLASYFEGENMKIINIDIQKKNDSLTVETSLIGSYLTIERQKSIEYKLKSNISPKIKVSFVQGVNDMSVEKKIKDFGENIRTEFFSDMLKRSENTINAQKNEIDSLKAYIKSIRLEGQTGKQVLGELRVQYPQIISVSYQMIVDFSAESNDTIPTLIITSHEKLDKVDISKIQRQMQIRFNKQTMRIVNL